MMVWDTGVGTRCRMDGTAVVDDNSAGRDCGKADRTRKVQGKVDGNDRNARRSCGKADRTQDTDCTRKTATAVSAVGTGGTVAGGTGSCVSWCGDGRLLGVDVGRYRLVVLLAIHTYHCLIQCHIPHSFSQCSPALVFHFPWLPMTARCARRPFLVLSFHSPRVVPRAPRVEPCAVLSSLVSLSFLAFPVVPRAVVPCPRHAPRLSSQCPPRL